ncbi:hypothetical protein [Armatimonas sp.]|uniref:hypothetical protein n=1 Tax=Armatimonas sp. TaxID=1872638 RepID=UPI00286C7DC9|nr:hypothetical protein [Armatimonas sp.]
MKKYIAGLVLAVSIGSVSHASLPQDAPPKGEEVEYCRPGDNHKHSYKLRYYAAVSGNPAKRPLVVLAPGANPDKVIDHNDPLATAIAQKLAMKGFNVAVVHYRKFGDGVVANDYAKAKEWGPEDIRHAMLYLQLMNGQKLNVDTKFVQGKGITASGGFPVGFTNFILGGLSFGGYLTSSMIHKGDLMYADRRDPRLIGAFFCSTWVDPGALSGYMANTKIPVAIVHNTKDGIPIGNNGTWAAGGQAISEELLKRGFTVKSTFITTPCFDNHVPRVDKDSVAVVDEYVNAVVSNILALGL